MTCRLPCLPVPHGLTGSHQLLKILARRLFATLAETEPRWVGSKGCTWNPNRNRAAGRVVGATGLGAGLADSWLSKTHELLCNHTHATSPAQLISLATLQ